MRPGVVCKFWCFFPSCEKKTRDCGNLQYTENDLFVHSALNTQETNVVGKHTGNSAMSTHSAEKEQTIAQIVNWKMGVHNVYYTSIRTKELLFDTQS